MGQYERNGQQVLHFEGSVRTHIADAADAEKADFLTVAANNYSDFDYMAEADKTCSIVYGADLVDREQFIATLKSIAALCEELNLTKKLLFRGKSPADVGREAPLFPHSLAAVFNPMPGEVDILHGIVGVITEAGEMAEVMLHRIEHGEFDRVNVMEEGGDVLWYLARQLRGIGGDFDMMGRINIDKLHGRHGEAFDVFRDANRDLKTERAKLETAAPLFDAKPAYGQPFDDTVARDPAKADGYATNERPCLGDDIHRPPEPGLVWDDGCWRLAIVRDIPGLA